MRYGGAARGRGLLGGGAAGRIPARDRFAEGGLGIATGPGFDAS